MAQNGAEMDVKTLLAKWEAELAQLDAHRVSLVSAISMARKELGLSEDVGTGPATLLLPAPPRDREVRPYLGMNILSAARLYLGGVREPKTPTDIAEAIRQGGVHSRSRDFAGVVRTTLSRNGDTVGIESFGNQTWGLREWRPGRRHDPGDRGDSA